jgi:hypothetical protein
MVIVATMGSSIVGTKVIFGIGGSNGNRLLLEHIFTTVGTEAIVCSHQ